MVISELGVVVGGGVDVLMTFLTFLVGKLIFRESRKADISQHIFGTNRSGVGVNVRIIVANDHCMTLPPALVFGGSSLLVQIHCYI